MVTEWGIAEQELPACFSDPSLPSREWITLKKDHGLAICRHGKIHDKIWNIHFAMSDFMWCYASESIRVFCMTNATPTFHYQDYNWCQTWKPSGYILEKDTSTFGCAQVRYTSQISHLIHNHIKSKAALIHYMLFYLPTWHFVATTSIQS